ncbi:titin homolog [Maniola jurtina]|uniref:titin homolog n=1 Tax=Maniola jurtina TaxID=191418 RepID=UPI001E68EF17|nr:titin homolog [Maniola jurtina]
MEPPSFSTIGPRVVRAAPGGDASLVLPLPSGSPPFHFEWSRAGAKLDDRFKSTHGAGGVRLTISTVSTGDSGVYTLQASNAAGKDTTRVQLEVSPDEKPTGEDPPTFLRRLQDLTVKVGTRTRFLVEIVSSTECRVTWYRNERRLLEAERIALVRDGNFWCADISAVSVDDAGRWTCTAENVGGRASCSAHLNVLVPKAYKRPEFVEELRALLTEQGTVSLECKVVGVPTPVLRWFKDSREIKAGDVFALTANAEDPTSLGTYTCEAVNCMGRAYSSSKVHVIGRSSRESSARPTSGGIALEPPPIFTKELEDQFVRICEPLTLSCHIVVPPWPRSIVWYNKEGKIEPSEKYRVLEDGVGGYLLEVPSAEWPDEGEWKCVATSSGGRIGITTCYVSMDVPKNYRKPRFMENLQAVLTEEGLVSFECKVVGFPTPVLSWFKDGQELKPGDVYQLTGTNSLGSYCCIARNCMGQASSSAELTVEDIQNQLNEEEKLQLFSKNQAPKFLQGLKSVEAKIDEPFRFTIKVAIPPEPTVLWYRDDQPVDESSRCHHGKEERGVFFLDIQSLEFMDQAEWKCVAMNDFGHSETSCFLKLIIPRHFKKPRFLENLQAILSDEGAVNLECKVIGVPQPVLKWYKDGEELKPGDIHRIISGQDGTCCLGTYTCEAQNCMGIAASSASLLGFEDSMKTKNKKKVDEQTLQRNLSLSTIHEERTSQMYDTPIGDITLDDKGEISFSFDGKEVSVSLYETPDLTEEEALQIVEMYADQLSENVSEHNVVELPPLRFVKETSTSGNLLMEAIIIDVSPEYFTSPEEDLRTEADIEDISIADENGLPHLSLDQEIDGDDYLEKTMARLSDEKADFPKKTDRKKSDSQKSVDDYFSLSRDQSLSEEKRDDDTQALSESDLQSFASARSSGKVKSKSSKPSIEDGQESSDVTKTVLLKEDLQTLRKQNEIELGMKNIRERERRSRSSRRSSSSSEKSLNKNKEEILDSNFANVLVEPTFDQEKTNAAINTICSTLTNLINDVQMIERDIILKSELMSTAATATQSLEIINSIITPLSEIHSIAEAIKETVKESLEVKASLFNRLPQSLSILHQSLTIIEKCIDLESENKTLVKKTCTNIIEKCADELNKLVNDISSIVNVDSLFLEDTCVSSIHTTNCEILNTITYSVAAIKENKKVSDKIDTSLDEMTPELKHLQKTQKAVYELRNPLKSLLHITEAVDISSFISAEHISNTQIILNDMSTPIQELQSALEQIEFLSVTETQSSLQKYNTEIMETVMDSVIKLRTSFEQISEDVGTAENVDILEKVLVGVKHNINEISAHLDMVEAKIGSFDVLSSENKLEALQKMAQILINLENNLVLFDVVPCLKIHMADFHKNLTKVLEHVIESNEAKKYFTFLEICDGVSKLNALIKNMDSNEILSLAGISNNLKIIQANIKKNEFTADLNFSILSNINNLLVNIHETMNHADISTCSMISENLEDLSIRHFEEGKLNIVLEQIDKAISTISNVVSLETTKDLDIKQALNKIIPTLEEIRCCVASLNVNVNEQDENISDMSNFTFTQAVANPLCELNIGISVLNQIICEKTLDRCENELKVELVTPLLELHNALEVLQQDVISQNSENINNLSIISSVANAVQSIQSCILMIQEPHLLENADELSTLDDISAIKTSAEILSCDHLLTPTVHEMPTEIDTQVATEFETQIMQSVSAKILSNLNDHISMLQKPEIMEILDDLSKYDEHSSIKSITTGISTIHFAIEEILHPVILEESQELSNFINPIHLSVIMQPVQELYKCLSVLDKNNMPIESALKKDQAKFLSQYLSKLEDCLRETIDCLHVAIETADITLEISTQIDKLRKSCVELKKYLDTAKIDAIVESSEFIILENSLTTILNTTDCSQEINIARVKLALEKLQQTIVLAKDEILGFTVENPVVLHHETKVLKSVVDIENTIASLAQLQFVDIGQVSDFDSGVSQQVDKEVNCDQLNKIENIVETIKNCIQQLPLDMPNSNNLISAKNFVATFNDEITLLCCLFNQKPTAKQMVKMLQLFYDLFQNLKQFQLHQEEPYTVSEEFNGWMATLEECLNNIQALLLELLESQHKLVFDIPISNIRNEETTLNKLLESSEFANSHHFVKLLLNTIESIKPWFENIHADVVKELESCNFNLNVNDDADKNFAILSEYLSEIIEIKDVKNELDIEGIFKVIQKHAYYKNIRGTGKKIIFIKCISDCLDVLKQTLGVVKTSQEREIVVNLETTPDAYELKKLLTELSGPIEILYETIMHICDENLQITDKSIILKHLELLESQAKAINEAKVAEKLLKFKDLSVDPFADFSTVNLAKDIVSKIRCMQNRLENLESAFSVDLIMNIQPIKEIEKNLNTLFADNKVVNEEKSQFKDKSDSLLQHMEQYIEIIEIVEEVSAVIKLDDFKKSANIVRELRESITSETSPDINLAGSELSIKEEQVQLAQNLQKALTTLQIDALDSEQELAPLINDDIRHQIIEVISDLQNDLVALTSIDVALENSELSEIDKQMKQQCIMSTHEEEGVGSVVEEIKHGQYAIKNSEENLEETLNVISTDLVTQCDSPLILDIEEAQHKTESSNTSSLDICDQKQPLELKSDIDPLHLKMPDLSEMKFDAIKDTLRKDINDYLRQDTVDDIKKLLPSESFEQLEQSLQIAVEVHNNAILEDSSSPGQQAFLKKQLELVLTLQEVISAIYSKNLCDVNEKIVQNSLQTAKSVVQNLLDSVQIYIALINTIIESEGEIGESKTLTKQTCEENATNSTISDENIFINDDLALATLNERQRSEHDFTVVEEDNNFNDVNALPEDMYKTRIVGNENVNDEFNIESATTIKVILEDQKLDDKALELELTEHEGSSSKDSKSPNFMATIENITDINIADSINVQEESIDTNNKKKTVGEINNKSSLNEENILMDSNGLSVIEIKTSVQDEIIPGSEDTYTDKEKSNAVLQLETLLQEANETVYLSEDYPIIQNSEELQDILEEVQTVILKLKCDFDGSRNEILNENIEDLECNVRSVQLQINENCPPALLKEACANLQTLANSISNIHNTQNTFSKENNALSVCINEAEQVIEILEEVSCSKVDTNLDNIILNLNDIKGTMKSLKSCFMDNAESLILRGIEVLQNLDHVEEKVFALEKELEANSEIDVNFRDSIIAATHSIYGSISDMRGNLCSIQKKYMYDNYGQPSINFLKSIKNVNLILNYDKNDDWKKFAKSLRKVLNHFEDVKFYINFDKTARLPSDSAFTKILLGELSTMLSIVLQNTKDLDNSLTDRVKEALNYVSETLNKMENRTTLEVKEKIPIFKKLSIKMYDITETIKIIVQTNIDNINQPSEANEKLSKKEENVIKISHGSAENDESTLINIVNAETTNVINSISIDNNEVLLSNKTLESSQDESEDAQQLRELKKEKNIIKESEIQMTGLDDINRFEKKDNTTTFKNQNENDVSTLDSCAESIVVIPNDKEIRKLDLEKEQDIKKRSIDILDAPDNYEASQIIPKVEEYIVDYAGEVLTPSESNDVVQSLNIEEMKEDKIHSTIAKQLIAEDSKSYFAEPEKQQQHDKIISLDSLQYAEQKDSDSEENIGTLINENTVENLKAVQQNEEKEEDMNLKIKSNKVDSTESSVQIIKEDLLTDYVTDTKSNTGDAKMAEIKILEVSEFSNTQGKADEKDEPQKENTENTITDNTPSKPKDLETIVKKEEEIQSKLQQVTIDIEEDILIEKMADTNGSSKIKDKIAETQIVEGSVFPDSQSRAEMKYDSTKEKSESNILNVGPSESIDMNIIKEEEEEIQGNLQEVEIKESEINSEKILKSEENEKETVVTTGLQIDIVKNGQTSQEDISSKEYDKTTPSTSSEELIKDKPKEEYNVTEPNITELKKIPISIQEVKTVEIAQNLKTEDKNKIISQKPQQAEESCIIEAENTDRKLEDNTKEIAEEAILIVNDQHSKSESPKIIMNNENSITEEKTDKAEIIMEVCGSQDLLYESMTTDMEIEKEDETQLFSASDKSRCKMNEEECQEKQSNQSVLINNNEENLQDKAKKNECKPETILLEEIESKQHIVKLDVDEHLDIERSKGEISSKDVIDSNISTLLEKQSDSKDVETKEENECVKKHFSDKTDKTEPKIKTESENSDIQVTLSNVELQQETDSKVSDENMNVEKEIKDIATPIQKSEPIKKEQDQHLDTSEIAETPDGILEKQNEKPKAKVKKTIKGKNNEKKHLKKQEEVEFQSIEKPQISQTENLEKKIIEMQEENKLNQYCKNIKTEEENENNVKPIEDLREQPVVQSDKNKDQIINQQIVPEEILPKTDDINIIETEKYSEKRGAQKRTSEIHLQDYKQQPKTEEKETDEILNITPREKTCELDGESVEKKKIDSNQTFVKKENLGKPEKELGEKHLIETDTVNVERNEQDQQLSKTLLLDEINNKIKNNNRVELNTSEIEAIDDEKSRDLITKEEKAVKHPRDVQEQPKIIDNDKNKDIKETKEICGLNKANENEILKPDESYTNIDIDIPIGLIDGCTSTKKLQKSKNVLTEYQIDEKHTLGEDYSLHGQSAYCADELQSTSQERNAINSDDIQESNLISRNEINLDSKVSKHKEIRQRPLFIDRSQPDYGQDFARPPGYTTKLFDNDNSPLEIKTTSKSPTIYRAQTLVQESQLKSSLPPYIDQRSNISEGRSEHKQRSNTTSDSKSTISEKRGSYSRDFKRKPVFSTYLTDRTAVESSRVKLTCSVLSVTDPKITWYKNGTLLDNKHNKCRTKCVDGLITLEILNAVPSDSGEYSCTVENENGSVTSSANLKVYPGFEASPIPPTFTRSIRDTYHLHENELVLECRIRGQPLPTITWLKDNRPILMNERYQAHYLADGVCRLTIQSPNEDDSGKYTCKAENSMWSDQITHEVYFTNKERRHIKNIASSEYVRLNRQATESRRPHFTNVLSDHKVVSGGTIGLQVEISGSPTRVEWLREGQSVTETYRNAQTYIDRGLYTLALSDVTEKESGLYTCRAWSTHGTVDMNASITVVQPNQFEGKPATIISRPVKDLLISVGEDLNISFRVQGEPKPKVFLMKGIRDITNSQRVCKMTSDDYVKFTLKRSVIADAGTYCVFARNAYGCDRAFVTVVIRQRASSDHLISDWTYPMDDLAISVVDRNYQSVPDRIPSEPTTVDGGNNWVSLAWPKPVSQVKAPILAYKVENWLLGKEGGARWVELGITPRNCFDAFNLKQGEEYHFRVTPRNRYGWGESVQTSIPIRIGLVGDRPEFIEILPGQLKVLVGETATLCCSFKGNPMPEIVWMKNGHEVEEETERVVVQLNGNNTSLQINDINIEDEGRYSCEATNIHGRSSTYSRMAVITDRQIWAADAKLKRERSAGANGEYPPQFTMRLRDRRVQATYPVRLTCQVIGSPSPIVTWFKDGEEVSVDSRRTTSQDEYFYTLEIAPTTLDDGGVYEAMARNGCGAISCRCNLVVDKGIRAYIAPEFCCGFDPLYRVCEGDELRISAVVEAYPSVGVTWYRDGVRLRTSRRAVMTLDRDGQIELALASVAARDAGIYTCTASNEVGRASTSCKVEVVQGEQTSETPKVPPIVVSPDLPYSKEPMFIKKPRSSEAHEGDTVIIECEVIGDPKPEVYWLRDFLKPDYYRDSSHFKRVGAGPAYRFEIPHAKFDYTGAYSIVAKNIHGEAKAIISLQILVKDSTCSDDTHNIRYGRVEVIPRFDKELTDLLCYDGDAIEFECRVSGNPEPDIRWIHYTEVLPECPDFETSYDLGTARLKIKQVTAEDEGTYTCEASNSLGKATSSACLVIYPPGEPNTLSQRLRRPPALLSASSTPRSTPRTTPARSLSRTPGPDLRRLCSPSREIAPKFYTYPYNRVVEEGDTVVFQCAVRGLPPPWATWDKDGIIITPTARISIREKEDMFRILEIEQVTIEDVGLYRVTLENDYGRAEASARLEVISQTGKFYGSRSYSVSPRKCLPYRRRTPSLTRQD